MNDKANDGVQGPLVVIVGAARYGGAWGSGKDLNKAKAQFRRSDGVLSLGYTVVTFGADTAFLGVDGLGQVHYRGPQPEFTEVEGRTR